MPTISREQIIEMELTLTELLEQLAAEKLRADAAEAKLREIAARYPDVV